MIRGHSYFPVDVNCSRKWSELESGPSLQFFYGLNEHITLRGVHKGAKPPMPPKILSFVLSLRALDLNFGSLACDFALFSAPSPHRPRKNVAHAPNRTSTYPIQEIELSQPRYPFEVTNQYPYRVLAASFWDPAHLQSW